MAEVTFERYDSEFVSLTDQVKKSLSSIQNASGEKDPQQELNLAKGTLSQCDDLMKQMSVEARSVDDPTAKKNLLHKVRICKTKLANLRDDFNNSRKHVERQALLPSSSSSSGGGKNSGHRERLLKTNNDLEAQNQRLENARRVMAETEDVALEITSELGRNREKIESAHGRVREVSGLTNQARRIVQSMSRREVQQKLAMYIVSILLMGTLLIVIVRMWS